MSEKQVTQTPSSAEKADVDRLPTQQMEKASEKATGDRTFNQGKEVSK